MWTARVVSSVVKGNSAQSNASPQRGTQAAARSWSIVKTETQAAPRGPSYHSRARQLRKAEFNSPPAVAAAPVEHSEHVAEAGPVVVRPRIVRRREGQQVVVDLTNVVLGVAVGDTGGGGASDDVDARSMPPLDVIEDTSPDAVAPSQPPQTADLGPAAVPGVNATAALAIALPTEGGVVSVAPAALTPDGLSHTAPPGCLEEAEPLDPQARRARDVWLRPKGARPVTVRRIPGPTPPGWGAGSVVRAARMFALSVPAAVSAAPASAAGTATPTPAESGAREASAVPADRASPKASPGPMHDPFNLLLPCRKGETSVFAPTGGGERSRSPSPVPDPKSPVFSDDDDDVAPPAPAAAPAGPDAPQPGLPTEQVVSSAVASGDSTRVDSTTPAVTAATVCASAPVTPAAAATPAMDEPPPSPQLEEQPMADYVTDEDLAHDRVSPAVAPARAASPPAARVRSALVSQREAADSPLITGMPPAARFGTAALFDEPASKPPLVSPRPRRCALPRRSAQTVLRA
jgi:hypothetical protein